MTRRDIIDLIRKDPWMMKVIGAAESLNLPDWWIGAGFIRSKVWDNLHRYKTRTPLPDVDLIYFDRSETDPEVSESKHKANLMKLMPGVKWQVKNQARMHVFHERTPYKNSEEGLSEWTETATCVGVRLVGQRLELTAPHGIDDLVNGILRPTFKTKKGLAAFNKRVKEKHWLQKWPQLRVIS